ncbi:MAG: methylglyoxal synthase [Paraglaciecola sp.]|jgi:methylglyoxal synthase
MKLISYINLPAITLQAIYKLFTTKTIPPEHSYTNMKRISYLYNIPVQLNISTMRLPIHKPDSV